MCKSISISRLLDLSKKDLTPNIIIGWTWVSETLWMWSSNKDWPLAVWTWPTIQISDHLRHIKPCKSHEHNHFHSDMSYHMTTITVVVEPATLPVSKWSRPQGLPVFVPPSAQSRSWKDHLWQRAVLNNLFTCASSLVTLLALSSRSCWYWFTYKWDFLSFSNGSSWSVTTVVTCSSKSCLAEASLRLKIPISFFCSPLMFVWETIAYSNI